jgi:hypothetical protein
MNVQPITRANGVSLAATDDRPNTLQPREMLVQQTATLARQLADVMLANVQNTASLNLSAARALLAHARIPTPAVLQLRSDTWRHSWRSFEVCATSADQMLNLTRGHVERTTSALWRVTERLVGEMAQLQAGRIADLRAAFTAMRDAQAAYWRATQQVHGELVALAQAPARPPVTEAIHGTH